MLKQRWTALCELLYSCAHLVNGHLIFQGQAGFYPLQVHHSAIIHTGLTYAPKVWGKLGSTFLETKKRRLYTSLGEQNGGNQKFRKRIITDNDNN